MALLPEKIKLERKMVCAALNAVVTSMENLPPQGMGVRSYKTLLPCSHAAMAMSLLKNERAFVLWHKINVTE
jgi:hypothetical protein